MNDETFATADTEKRSIDITDDGVPGMIRTNDPSALERSIVTCNSLEDILFLAAIIPETSAIKHLCVNGCDFQDVLGPDASAKLAASIERMTSLEHFQIAHCDLCVEMLRPIASAIANAALRSLTLNTSGIGDDEVKAIADSFTSHHSLASLRMNGNDIGRDGAIALSSFIAKLPNLQNLLLFGNRVSADGAAVLATALAEKRSFHLDLAYNRIGDEGAAALAGLLSSNSNILQLSLCGNLIGPVGFSALARGIAENQSLQDLDISYNDIGNAEVIALASLLTTNNTIKSVNLQEISFGEEGAEALARAIAVNRTIECLDIRKEVEDEDDFLGMDDMLQEEDDEGEYDKIFMGVIYNKGSMETILSSNHTLKTLFPAGDDLRSTLALNRGGVEKAKRKKIVKFLNEKPKFVLSTGVGEKLMPTVLEKIKEFDAMFELLRNMPDLFRAARRRPYRECRKRSRLSH